MQICLGAVYGWSVFVKPLQTLPGVAKPDQWALSQVSLTFTIALLFLGAGTVIGGLWQDRVGPRLVASVAGVLYGLGFLVAAWGVSNHSLTTLYLGYGVISGFGMGMGYICPVATITKWFPDRRGLMTGLAVMGYGAGAVVMGPIAARLMQSHTVAYTFTVFGIIYGVVVLLTAQFFVNPPLGWKPAGWQPQSAVAKAATTRDYTVSEAMRTWRFWLLWLMLFLNVSAGIMIISQASPLAQSKVFTNMSAAEAATAAAGIVAVISIFNAIGRLFWAWVSDFIGRATVYFILYAIQAVVFFLLPGMHERMIFTVAMAIIGLCYGGGFGVMPSFTADFFGSKFMGGIYGWILLAWGLGGAPTPILIARVKQATGTYDQAIYTVAVVMICSLVLPLLARRPANR